MYQSPPLLAVPISKSDGTPVIGLALGSGAARGWAHLGVIAALEREGIRPDVICGCSIGALVGAAYASGKAGQLHEWVLTLDWQAVLSMLDISLRGGLIRGDRVVQYCAQHFFDADFTTLRLPFACVATELASGREMWLREGSVADAVRASIALPGLFSPVLRDGRVLVDGGLANPVPVSLCRAMGADVVIAVELGSGMVGRHLRRGHAVADTSTFNTGWSQRLLSAIGLGTGTSIGNSGHTDGSVPGAGREGGAAASEAGDARKATEASAETTARVSATLPQGVPSWIDVVTSSINIMQMRIARSRLAGEPADMLVSPRVANVGMMEFDCAGDVIAEGEAAVRRVLPNLKELLQLG